MPQDRFSQRKQDILSKKDKSHIGKWDERIVRLCKKINSFDNYYTTSSCSGRIIIISDQDKKAKNLFLKRYHDYLHFEQLKKDLQEIAEKNNKLIKIKLDPCALHVACDNLESANDLINKAKLAGWKKSGIITANKRYIVELNSTERLEFPIINSKEILVNDRFLKILVKRANEKLNKTWEKINILEENL